MLHVRRVLDSFAADRTVRFSLCSHIIIIIIIIIQYTNHDLLS